MEWGGCAHRNGAATFPVSKQSVITTAVITAQSSSRRPLPVDTNAMSVSTKQPNKIHWTITDEAPALATHALLPIITRFTEPCGVSVEAADISVAGRILATFPSA